MFVQFHSVWQRKEGTDGVLQLLVPTHKGQLCSILPKLEFSDSVGSLKLTMVGIFTPQKWANLTNHSFHPLPSESSFTMVYSTLWNITVS